MSDAEQKAPSAIAWSAKHRPTAPDAHRRAFMASAILSRGAVAAGERWAVGRLK